MTDSRPKALDPQSQSFLEPASRLAERTLAERIEREKQALVANRTLVVGPGGYATISEAVSAARDGDIVSVRPGRYEESVVVRDKTITIRGDGERDTIVVGWDRGPAFTLVETRSRLTGLTIVGGGDDDSRLEPGAALRVSGGAPQLHQLRMTRGRGVAFDSGAAGSISNSDIDGNDRGIYVYGGASPRIEENEIWGNAKAGIAIGGTGTEPLIRANLVHDGQANGMLVVGGASPTIDGNTFTGNALEAIEVDGDSDPEIGRNLVIPWPTTRQGARPQVEALHAPATSSYVGLPRKIQAPDMRPLSVIDLDVGHYEDPGRPLTLRLVRHVRTGRPGAATLDRVDDHAAHSPDEERDRRADLNRRLRQAFIEGAEEDSRRRDSDVG